jgi:hypothetical protein
MSDFSRREGESEREHSARMTKLLLMADVMRRDRIMPDDPDFSEKVSPYLAGEIDPSVARYMPLNPDRSVPDDVGLSLYGYNGPYGADPIVIRNTLDGHEIDMTLEPDTVGAVHTQNTPQVYGHEYRHRNFPELFPTSKEKDNRLIDLVAAQTGYDVDTSIRMYANALREGKPSEVLDTVDTRLKHLATNPYDNTHLKDFIRKETGKEPEEVVNASATKKFMGEVNDLEDWKEGLSDRNKKRKAGDQETVLDIVSELLEKMGY